MRTGRDRRRRGAGAVAAPDPGAAAAGLVHRGRRIDQPGRGVGPLGDARRVRGVQALAANGVGRDAVLRINVSPIQLVTEGFVRDVAETIEEFGLDGGSVCLEITESAVVHDIETTRNTLGGAQRSRGPDRHRRLRHRLQRAVAPEIAAGRHAQDRHGVRARPGHQRRRSGDRARHHRRSPRRSDCKWSPRESKHRSRQWL